MRTAILILILGSGTSTGVPQVGCECETCRSTDPRDSRTRASIMFQWDDCTVVVDTTPEFRLQMLRERVARIDAVLFTHNHADHVHGLDDVRPYTYGMPAPLPVYAAPDTAEWIRHHFAYVWKAVQQGGGLPRIELRPVEGAFDIDGLRFTPLPVMHGVLPIYGYRVADFAYLTDVSDIPAETMALLDGVHTLVIGAVRYKPHATHCHVDGLFEQLDRVCTQKAAEDKAQRRSQGQVPVRFCVSQKTKV